MPTKWTGLCSDLGVSHPRTGPGAARGCPWPGSRLTRVFPATASHSPLSCWPLLIHISPIYLPIYLDLHTNTYTALCYPHVPIHHDFLLNKSSSLPCSFCFPSCHLQIHLKLRVVLQWQLPLSARLRSFTPPPGPGQSIPASFARRPSPDRRSDHIRHTLPNSPSHHYCSP